MNTVTEMSHSLGQPATWLEKRVSFFKNVMTSYPFKEAPIGDFIEQTKHNSVLRQKRKLIQDDEQLNALKKKAQCICPSGVFKQRANNKLVRHSQLICIDIDAKENTHVRNWEEMKDQLKYIAQIAYCGYSFSGKGLWLLIPILHPLKHKAHYEAICKQLYRATGLKADRQCSDVSRLRTLSFDPEPIINENPITFHLINETASKTYSLTASTTTENEEKIKLLLGIQAVKRVDVTANYCDWFCLGSAMANCFGESGRHYFLAASQFYPDYQPEKCNRFYSNLIKKSYGHQFGTIVYIFKKYGLHA